MAFSRTSASARSTSHRFLCDNQRGAAFLLAVYFAALTLLLFGGISFQRTTMEIRAAQLARDQQQAFWLAEAGLDQAIKRIRQSPMNVDTTTPF
ncbi:MAG: hypothetical protein HY352_06440, partial [Candidatus Omnitrophica bacterium]|nr:hypothetical protein [Candidatus Omnitrophota bacterium]